MPAEELIAKSQEPKATMRKPIKYVEKAVTVAARGAWVVFDRLNRIKPNPSPTPKWSDKPLLKSYEKSKPPLGWPRTTDSLCPKCVPEIRQQILDGHLPHEVLMNEKPGSRQIRRVELQPASDGEVSFWSSVAGYKLRRQHLQLSEQT